ncbi:glycosyltransferase [Barnesiella viscericola]|uniref:glycosyltransferase n=1 Tax=Barnesiella viscericola TaxID=397865 RepID=UPI0025A42212|nr:glycosyltransferase [Barnesiella viscericola]MDM8268481.1 glycosyltransferase [Barnesiella viscericola]
MISMIVCSVDPAKLEKFCENVLMTVGCPCEFVVHDNRETGYGITHVYNLCAAKAKGEYLCFAHEDIFFRTPDWGERIVSLLQRPATGVVGFAGSTAKLAAYSGWGSMKQYTRYNYIQRFRNGSIKYCIANPDKVSASPVIVLDGMCLFMRKEVWAETRFDEATFQGFHLYDLDISMAVGQKYVNYVTNDVLLEHFSEGSYNQPWLDDTVRFHRKWADRLPFYIEKPNPLVSYFREIKMSFLFIRMLMKKRVGSWDFIELCCREHVRRYYWHITSLKLLQRLYKYKRQWRREGRL